MTRLPKKSRPGKFEKKFAEVCLFIDAIVISGDMYSKEQAIEKFLEFLNEGLDPSARLEKINEKLVKATWVRYCGNIGEFGFQNGWYYPAEAFSKTLKGCKKVWLYEV